MKSKQERIITFIGGAFFCSTTFFGGSFETCSIFCSKFSNQSNCLFWSFLNLGHDARTARSSSSVRLRNKYCWKSFWCLARIAFASIPINSISGFFCTLSFIAASFLAIIGHNFVSCPQYILEGLRSIDFDHLFQGGFVEGLVDSPLFFQRCLHFFLIFVRLLKFLRNLSKTKKWGMKVR